MYKATIILTTHNRKDTLEKTVKCLENMDGVSNIIILDNGSQDATKEWLAEQTYEYIYFDEGTQGYGQIWNAALENFETEDYVVFLEAGVYPEKDVIKHLIEALSSTEVGIASPVLNQNECKDFGRVICDKTLATEWKIWAVRKEVLNKNGYFQENLKCPENVLLDYGLRLIKNDFYQQRLHVCVNENLHSCNEIYTETTQWDEEDLALLKSIWGINYIGLEPNPLLTDGIQEEKEKTFNVLEIGCNLGVTLFEIQSQYPNCKTYGLEINEAAVDVAKHIADVRFGDIDDLKVPFTEKFDYIILGDVLEHLRHPKEVVQMCRNLLNENGYIIASIPNIMHISVMEELINGRFIYEDVGLLDKTHIHFFTYYEILQLLMETNYRIIDMKISRIEISDEQKELEKKLLALSEQTEALMYEAFQYIVKAQKI